METLKLEALKAYWAKTFRTQPGRRVRSIEEAVDFVNERGFIYFWPIKDVLLPSLWAAVAGDRPVADEHDDPGHVTWGWKDSLLGQRRWYYAKVLRGRATIIALNVAPYFYALSENYGAPEEDYLTSYEQGRLTLEAKQVYEALLDNGPLDSVALRKAAHMTSVESEARFNRALTDLQTDFKILPVGVADAGAWHYAFIYQVAAHYFTDLPELAHKISERQARQKLADLYLQSVGAAQLRDVTRLFGWRPPDAQRALDSLVQAEQLREGVHLESSPGEWYTLAEIPG